MLPINKYTEICVSFKDKTVRNRRFSFVLHSSVERVGLVSL